MEHYSKKLFIIFSILILGFAASFAIFSFSYNYQTKNLNNKITQMEQAYAQKVSTEKNAYNLTINGLRQFQSGLPNLATISIDRATGIEPNYRDAWLVKATINLKLHNTSIALESALKAEKLDPINPETYEILVQIYTEIDNQPLAQAAQIKLDFLTKK